MTLPGFTLVTGNPDKRREAEAALGHAVAVAAMDLPEIQSLDLLQVLDAKGEEAWKRLQRPLVVEETGLELAALGGFPGPLVKWMLATIGAEGIAGLALALGETRAVARCALLYRDRDRQVVGQGETRGVLVLPPRGDGGFGWDPVFQPAGEERTYGELDPAAKVAIGHRGRAWRALAGKLADGD
ncbi:MAG TPA: non-canonical purine NTP pyrophosphatase [Thermoanaerobaculia bacterium]|nr:non-canonical purine NTP pyrophosphatase [Thermoanaerobaculia bacterium]